MCGDRGNTAGTGPESGNSRSPNCLRGILACLAMLLPIFPVNAACESSALYASVADKIHSIGFDANWQKHIRQQALRASAEKHPYLANRLFRQLARYGDRDAAFRLGLFYDVGATSDRNPSKAIYWYRRAAAAGEIHALHNLGVAYANGKGVALDMQQAIKWWTRAAMRGNSDSQYNLGILYAAGQYGVTRNIVQARHWWLKAAQHGDAMAQYNLGTLYVSSDMRDYCEAARWWKAAASNGVEQAGLALRMIKKRQDYHTCR